MILYIDTESVGLVGNTKLIQYAIDDGKVYMIPLYRGWEGDQVIRARVQTLLNMLNDHQTLVVAYNAAHDMFHLYRVAHLMQGLPADSPERPVMPFACRVLDLYVPAVQHSILAPFAFQKSKSKSIARVRRIPTVALDKVVPIITDRLKQAVPEGLPLSVGIHQVDGAPHLKTVSWTLDARVSLKGLMKAYGIPTIPIEDVWPLPDKGTEPTWLPYPTPEIHDPIETQCEAVMRNPQAGFWKYAELDILYLKVLYDKLGRPEPDHHSDCTHVVGYTRYYGFGLDQRVLANTEAYYAQKVQEIEQRLSGIDLNSPKQRLEALRKLDPLLGSSAKRILQAAVEAERPCAALAADMLGYGPARQRLLQVQKVRASKTGRAHPSLRVMGTRTGRMAGEAGLNWQGIGQAEWVDRPIEEVEKEDAELHEGLDDLCDAAETADEIATQDAEERKVGIGIRAAMEAAAVGDWSQFEVALAAGIYPDAAMDEDLRLGNDAHCMTASLMHPAARRLGLTHDDLRAAVNRGDPDAVKIRKQSKAGSFGIQYWAQAAKISEVFGISLPDAQEALDNYYKRYAGFAAFRASIEKSVLTADTEHWSRDSVARMARSITDLTGYTMRWDFEAQVADILWQLGGTGIKTGIGGTVLRQSQKGQQTVDGAVKSALLGGALAIQQAVARQMGNAKVQASGANINKILQAQIWNRHRVPSLQIHDEEVFPSHPKYRFDAILQEVADVEARFKTQVPHLKFDIHPTKRWSDK